MKNSFTFPVVSFRNIETPFTKKGYKDYFCIINAKDLPNLESWRKINVRDPKLTGSVPKAIRNSFNENPELFLFMNRGIVLAAHSVSYDNKSSEVTITFKDQNLHGLLDGGHTYNIVVEEAKDLEDSSQYIKIEIIEGFGLEDIVPLVDARNTSNQVRDESLMNLSGDFDDLKKILKNETHYYNKIAFSEFEVDENYDPKPIDIRDIIAILTAFDKDNFTDTAHPINAYRSKASCLKHFQNHIKSYKKIYPLAKEILELYDHIQDKLPQIYNATGGKFGKLTGVNLSNSELFFINKNSSYSVPAGFIYPVLGAFRALLEEKNGKYYWGKNLSPVKMLEGPLGKKLATTIGIFALDAKNPSKTGKSPLVWQACYQSAENEYLKA